MTNNSLAVTHGLYARDCLTEREHQVYEQATAFLRSEYDLDSAADEFILDMIGFAAAKLWVARRIGNQEAIRKFSREIKEHLSDLGIKRDFRIKQAREGGRDDAQDFALAFMDRFKEGIKGCLPGKQDHPRIIDVEAADPAPVPRTPGTEGEGSDDDDALPLSPETEEEPE